ncbi:SRPBCC domain-containing protein [Nocardiopsis sp. NPDC006938]|uniref:SRPBCC family protein n=1 Tax=Nocardiopsis sp. NPDC006938 TaxID=3364337 RepID=UPI0036BA997D
MTATSPAVEVEARPDARRIVLTLPLDAPRPRVWAALTEHACVSRWLTPVVPDPDADHRHLLTFEHEGVTHTKALAVTVCEREERLAGTLHDPGFPDSSLEARIDGARLVLTHDEVPEELFAGYEAGWAYYLGNLHALLTDPAPGERR